MSNPQAPDYWTHGTRSGMVSIGPHSLFLSASGPPRISPSHPVVIIDTGLGSGSSEWVAAQRLMSHFARVYSYDRAGYGKSKTADSKIPLPASAWPPTAAQRCTELTTLLENAGIEPPWVLIGHSYGGTLVREFLLRHGKEKVKGLVILDSSITRTKLPQEWPTLLGDRTYFEVVGLEQNHCVTEEEWEQIKRDDTENGPTAAIEERFQEESTNTINERINGQQLLGNGRLSVIFANESIDFRKIYEWGVKMRNGTAATRNAMAKRLEDMAEVDEMGQRAHLSLSSASKFVRVVGNERTHNMQYSHPHVIVEEVKWILELS